MLESLEPRLLLANTVVEVVTSQGSIVFQMLNSAAPETVQNFMNYVTANRYDGTFIHRSISDFVVQMGGYKYVSDNVSPEHIPVYAPVINEFGTSNLAQTVAMAKTGDDPNSATSEFFINLKDNRHFNDQNGKDIGLDVQNGGFTVFANVIQGWSIVLAIAGLQTVNASGVFTNLPVVNYSGGAVLEPNLVKITDVAIISDPIPLFSAKGIGSALVRGAGAADRQTLFVTVNDAGRPIAFYQSSQTADWTVSDINLQSGGVTLAGQIVAWQDLKDGRFYAAAPTATGLLLYTRNNSGVWKIRNLNSEVPGASVFPVAAGLTVFASTGDAASADYVSIAGLNAQGQIVLFTQSSKTADSSGAYPWTFVNIHTADLASRGMATPTFVGPITSYVTSWNGQNIAGLDANGDVQAIWRSPGADGNRWRVDNLSDLTGAPALTGGLTPYLTPWGGINLASTDAAGKVVVTWWGGDPALGWNTNNLTNEFGGASPVPLVLGSLTSYVTPWGGLNVTGTTSDGKIVIYWWGGPGDVSLPVWKVTPLSDGVAGAIAVSGRILGVASPTGQINLTGLSANGNVLRYNWKPGELVWNMQDLTAIAKFF